MNSARSQESRRTVVMLAPHEPRLDPRIDWEAEAAAREYEVTVLGLEDPSRPYRAVENRRSYRIVRAQMAGTRLPSEGMRQLLSQTLGTLLAHTVIGVVQLSALRSRVCDLLNLVVRRGMRLPRSAFHRLQKHQNREPARSVVRLCIRARSIGSTVGALLRNLLQRAAGSFAAARGIHRANPSTGKGRGTGPVPLKRDKRALRPKHPAGFVFGYLMSATESLLQAHAMAGVLPDVVHCNDIYSLVAGIKLKTEYQAGLLYDAHELWPDALPGSRVWLRWLVKVCERRLTRFCDEVVTVTPQLGAIMEKWYELPHVRAVPNASVLDGASLAPTSRPATGDYSRQAASRVAAKNPVSYLARGRVTFLFQGNFAPDRGLEELIEAWEGIDGSKALLVLRGPVWGYAEQLQILAGRQIKEGKIVFLPPVREGDLVKEAATADVGLIPYLPLTLNHQYCCPNKLSQYMQAGLAVISNNLEYVKSIIERYNCGTSYDSDNPDTFVEVVETLITERELLATYKTNALSAGVTHFHWDAVNAPLMEAYRTLTRKRQDMEPAAEARITALVGEKLKRRDAGRDERTDLQAFLASHMKPVGSHQSLSGSRGATCDVAEMGNRVLQAHRDTRRVAYPAARLSVLREAVKETFPTSFTETLVMAKKTLEREFFVLGVGPYRFEGDIDWSSDLQGETWLKGHYDDLRPKIYENLPNNQYIIGDIKVPWDLNRHGHLFNMARAYALTGEETFPQEFRSQLESWWEQNPFMHNLAWTEPLIVAHRAIAWVFSMRFLIHSDVVDGGFYVQYLASLYQHLQFLRDHYPIGSNSSNHAFGSLAGALVVATTYPEFDISEEAETEALEILEREIEKQVYPDGIHYEQAVSYQRYILEFLYTVILCREYSGRPDHQTLRITAEKMAEYLRHVISPNGRANLISDADGAYAYKFDTLHINDYRPHLALGAALFQRGDMAGLARGCHEVVLWLLDPHYRMPDACVPRDLSRFFPEGGMVVMRSDWSPEASHLTFDCGNAGMGYSDDGKYTTHGHDDLLSITLSAGGRQLLVDRGSGSYTGDRAIHDSLRTSMAHNTVSLSAPIRERSRLLSAAVQSHSVTGSTWELERRARPFGRGFIASESVDLAWASHDGYRRYPNQPLHQRIVLFFKPGLFVVIDRITPLKASQHKFLYPLHFAPGTRLVDLDTGVIARTDGVELLCKLASPVPMLERNVYEGKKNPVLGWFAEDYGVLVPSPTVEYVGVVELPATMAAMFQVGKDVDPSAYDIRLIAADQCPEEIAVQAATDSYRIAFAGPDDRTLPNGETSASDAWLTIRKLERETHKETTWTVGQDVMEERAGDTVRHLRPITLMLGRCSRDGTDTLSAPPPSTIYIVINNKCNLRCKMCDAGQQNHQSQFYRLMRPKGRLLDLPTLKGLADHVAPFKPHIAIVGSEPLLFRDLFTFVEHVKSLGMEVQVTTNGLLLPAMAEKVVDSGVDYLWVSIDGPREVHNEIRGHKRSFQYAVNGIQLVHAFARQKERNLSIYVHCALSNHNYRHLVDFVEAIRTLPLESIQISHMNYVTLEMAQRHNRIHGHFCRATASSVSAADPRQVDADLLWDQMNVVKYYQYPFPVRFDPDLDRDGVRDFYHHPEKVLWTETCDIAWKAAHVAPNGDCIIATRCFEKSMGNIFEHDLLEIWNGQRYRDFRGWIRDVRLAPACTRCCSVL